MDCPICHREVLPSSPDFPFCSERCRLIDLGNWAGGEYRIPASSREAEEAGMEGENAEEAPGKSN